MVKILALSVAIFLTGCVGQPKPTVTQSQIEKNIVGKWHASYRKIAKDGVKISVDESDYFNKNGTMAIDRFTYFRDKNNKLIGSFLLKQKGTYKIYDNKIATLFLSCKTKALSRAKTTKVEFVEDIFKLSCKYANRLLKAKKSAYVEVDSIDNRAMIIKGIRFVKVR